MKVVCPYCEGELVGNHATDGDSGSTLMNCFMLIGGESPGDSYRTGCGKHFVFCWRKTVSAQCIRLEEQPA